jgi:hypothetical protein
MPRTSGSQSGSFITITGILTLLLFLVTAAHPASEEAGTISGYVTDRSTGEFLIGANVMIVGTQIGAITNTSGFYSIPNAPAGAIRVRVSFIGYATRFQSMNLNAGGICQARYRDHQRNAGVR